MLMVAGGGTVANRAPVHFGRGHNSVTHLLWPLDHVDGGVL